MHGNWEPTPLSLPCSTKTQLQIHLLQVFLFNELFLYFSPIKCNRFIKIFFTLIPGRVQEGVKERMTQVIHFNMNNIKGAHGFIH